VLDVRLVLELHCTSREDPLLCGDEIVEDMKTR